MQIFDVIKYDGPNDIFVWKYPGEDFNTLSQLIVHESQEAVFFKDGRALDLFGAGRYTLHSQNIPLIRRIVNLPFNGTSPFHCEVYFINRAVSLDVRWELERPVPIQDAIYGILLPVHANGQFGIRVVDSRKLLLTLVGTVKQFDKDTLKKYFRGVLLTNIKDYISKQFVAEQVSFLEIHSHLKAISSGIQEDLAAEFLRYGLELVSFNVNEIAPPDNDPSYVQLKNALAKKAEMSVMGYNYQQERTFDILDRAAASDGSASPLMGAGIGLSMGVNLGSVMGGAMENAVGNIRPIQQQPIPASTQQCPACGQPVPEGSKFCLNCGQRIESTIKEDMTVCPGCGATVPNGKFCWECGFKLEQVCAGCGAKLVPSAKFCFECGKKVE